VLAALAAMNLSSRARTTVFRIAKSPSGSKPALDRFRHQPLKRALDLALALPAFLVFLPVMGILVVLLVFSTGRPVLFTQDRPGLGGRIFKIYKFRSMTNARDATGELLPDAERLTSVGRFLRKTSLDELPQLLNVLKGELSLVGPRPLLVRYLPRYSLEQSRRHAVMPGITGWAQVNGRNAIGWDQKFALDVWYVDHWSLALDLRILALTIFKVFRREGIGAPGEATMPEFLGAAAEGDTP
jgi:sugar transferase EpsL